MLYFLIYLKIMHKIIKLKKSIFLLTILFSLINEVQAQTEFPEGDFWSLDAGFDMGDILVRGMSFQFVLDPKLWLSLPLMVGSRMGLSYSEETDSHNILTLEGQIYLRWNFLRLGSPENTTNIFVQGGIGLLAAYRGDNSPFDNVTMTRGSFVIDVAAGVTVPLSPRWHIEASIRAGYPHIVGFTLTAGYKFPLPEKVKYQDTPPETEHIEAAPIAIIQRIMIPSIDFILFGPDIGRYNVGIDHDAQGLNELTLNAVAQILKDNPDFRVRVEGNANTVTTDPNEADELMALGAMRANAVAAQLRVRGVSEEQMLINSYGGTMTVTHDHNIWNMNRRVELIIFQPDTN
jgi:outer membrane protein OmpA-like peptidoglycan-associated protein